MSNLITKFTDLETVLGSDHTEIITALDAIIDALGGVPPTPTTTLVDVVTAIEAQTTAQATQHAALMALLTDIFDSVDTIITNNSLNAQRLIAAIYATFCECATDTPLLAPPLDVTPTEIVDEAKCRRIQFYLSVFGNWLNKIANYGASGAAITSGTLSTLLSLAVTDAGIVATGAEVGAAGGIPGIVVGAVIGLIAVVVYTLGGSVLIDYANQFNDPTLRDNMVQAMYAATNADEGYTAFKSTLLAGMDTIPAEIIYTLWWSAWSNDVYSGSPEVDDSAFDGSICLPPADEFPPTVGCVTIASATTHFSDGQVVQCIPWPSEGGVISPASVSGAGADLIADLPVFGHADIRNLWVKSIPNSEIYWQATGSPHYTISSTYAQLPPTGGDYYCFVANNASPFEITMCATNPDA